MDLSSLPITRTLLFEAIGAIGASIGAFIVWRIQTRVQKVFPKNTSNDWSVVCEDDKFILTCHSSRWFKITVNEAGVEVSMLREGS